ncbi:Rossmann-like domain-containing protein [Thiosocius teredinicola]|uniref:Rossmann-like domain-containing protein n=1 Tax=Thiosocius teredinicola TaxID=1973002 RepID=UPI0009911030
MTRSSPHSPYDAIERACSERDEVIAALCIGLTWTTCRTAHNVGFAMSPGTPTRTLSWPGEIAGRAAAEVATWVRSWDLYEATVGLAAANALINTPGNALMQSAEPVPPGSSANLSVFEYFRPQLNGRKVVVVGRYPGLDNATRGLDVTVLERNPSGNDLADPAAEFVLPDADWVFLTSTSLINKTFPRLASLAENAVTVMMGPSTPWLTDWADFGVDFIAGVRPVDTDRAVQIAAEGGGTRLFGDGVQYAVADIGAERMTATKARIAETFARRDALKAEMLAWYDAGNQKRFPKRGELEAVDVTLSELDTRYKRQWDARNPH